jgi:hypothetical protein
MIERAIRTYLVSPADASSNYEDPKLATNNDATKDKQVTRCNACAGEILFRVVTRVIVSESFCRCSTFQAKLIHEKLVYMFHASHRCEAQ